MTREEYLAQLRARLSARMSPQELENVISYYAEYFDEAGPQGEAAVMAELGSPERLSRLIMGDKVLEELTQTEDSRFTPPAGGSADYPPPNTPPRPKRRGLSVLWTVLLALCAAPLAIPLVVAVVAVVIALTVAILASVIGVGAAGVACIAAGLFSAICGISVLFSAGIATTMFFVGGGLLAAGLGLLMIAGTVALAGLCFRGLALLVGRLIHGRRART